MAVTRFAGLLVLLPTLVASFMSGDSTFGAKYRSLTPFVKSSSSRGAAATSDSDHGPRNIFHDYEKPILLVGHCSAGDEMNRLAENLLQEYFPMPAMETTDKPAYRHVAGTAGGIVTVVSEAVVDDLLNNIDKKVYQWPDVIVMDLNKFQDEDEAILAVQRLYLSGLLGVYINVDPDASQITRLANRQKTGIDSFLAQFTDYELCIRDEGLADGGSYEWKHIEWELARLLARARLVPAVPGDTTRSYNTAHLTMGDNTFFLSLSFPEIQSVEPYVEEMCKDVDAMEYRTDLLKCRDSRFDLIYGMQLLRRYCRPHAVRAPMLPFAGTVIEDAMPIVYTVRTQNQAGTYPDDLDGIDAMFDLLQWGLRGGVEVLDVESAWDPERTDYLITRAEERYSSQILGSHHVVGKEVSLEEAVELFQNCSLDGRAHGAKVVLSIESDARDRMAYEASLIARELAFRDGKPVIPGISLILGEVGQFSRVINLPFTPVTHETLPMAAAPGQMTAAEIMTTRILTKIFEKKNYAILGHNIAYSVSPQMHGAAFEATRLPHQYVRADVESVEEFVESDFFESSNFGGTSVTIPHKQAIMPYMDALSPAAQEIGSVNTVVAKDDFVGDTWKRVLYGDNTDWRGIFNPLDRLLGSSIDPETDSVLILGAGGKW